MEIIGAGVGRTGTYSLKLAINRLGFGACHHMEEVLFNRAVQVPLWSAATAGEADWGAIYDGYRSAVDWPTAGFVGELVREYPDARFVLTVRSPESWAASFGETIYTLMASPPGQVPEDLRPWLAMAQAVVERTGFPQGLDREDLMRAFEAHAAAVKATVPPERLLVFEVREGWEPLCAFVGAEVPDEPFPRSNDRTEFWDRVAGAA